MKIGWSLLALVLIAIVLLVVLSSADFTFTPTNITLKTNIGNQTVNLTITDTLNLTQVNFTLPSGFTFVSDSNSTNATNWNFTSVGSILSWTNSTTPEGIVNGSAWFYFRVNTSLVFNNFSFTITTTNNTGVGHPKNISVIVEPEAVSINRKFGAQPAILYLNWTNYQSTNITLIANSSASNINETIIPEVDNSTAFTANYSQFNSLTACGSSMKLFVQNASGYGTIAGNMSGATTNTSNVSLVFNSFQCSPGRYRIGNLMIRNSTENLNISVILDIPISPNSTDNALNTTTGVGTFGYSGNSKLVANASTYHSYYFNASSMNYTEKTNVTSVTINLTGWSSSQDADLFLFDGSGNLKARSINKTDTVEWLTYSYLPTSPQMWEIRLFGNTTNSSGLSYYGYIIFSTLNVTNASNTYQNISMVNFTSLFGSALNFTNTSSINLTLKNEGNFNLTNVVESKELYYVQRFNNNGNQNISFFVPNSSIVSKVRVGLNWTGASNYSFNVYKSDGNLILSSINKFVYANVTNAMQEEYNETTNIGSTNGYWKIDVRNNTNVTDTYTVTVLAYVNASKWISSNFSTFSFNTSGQPNSTKDVNITLTVPNDTVDGKFEGYLQYKSSSGSVLRIPLEAQVGTAMLFINNSVGTSTVQIDENIGANLTKQLNITFNNTGSYSLAFVNISTGRLNLTTNSTNYIPFNFTSPSSPVASNTNTVLNITINISTSLTEEKQGLYEGSILFTTNDSYPYNSFTLNIKVNLTNLLVVNFTSLTSTTLNSSAENITAAMSISYINGTALTGHITALNDTTTSSSNFSSIWLSSSNVSGYRTSGSLVAYNGTNPIYISGTYTINITVPNNTLGGVYALNLFANYTRPDNRIFGGYGISSNQQKYITINNTGLYMSGNRSSIGSFYVGNATLLHANITNYGTVTSNSSTTTINFTESCAEYSVSGTTGNVVGTGCIASYTSSTNSYSLTVPNGTTCTVWWTVTGVTSGTCSGYIRGSGLWYNPAEVNVSVTVTNATTSGTTTTSTGTTTTTTTTNQTANLVFNKAENLIQLLQNSTNSTDVEVKNTGDISLGVTFKIEGIDSSLYTLNDTSEILASGKTAWFKVTFTVGDVDVKDYAGKFNASSASKTITKDFTLRVLPTPAKQVEINDTLALYKADAINLEVDINESKSKGINVTLIEQMMNDIKLKIEQAENYIKTGDYFSAYQLFTDINTLLNNTKTELANAKATAEAGKIKLWWIVAGVAAAIIGIGVLAYMFWPTKPGYHQEKGFTPKKEESLWNNLKDKWRKIKGGE